MKLMNFQEEDIDIDHHVILYASYCDYISNQTSKPHKKKFVDYVKSKYKNLYYIPDFEYALYVLFKCKNIFDDINDIKDEFDEYSFILDVDTFQSTDKKVVYKIIVNNRSYVDREIDSKKILDKIKADKLKEKLKLNKLKLKARRK